MRTILSTLSAVALMTVANGYTAEAQENAFAEGTATVDSIKVPGLYLEVHTYDAEGTELTCTKFTQYSDDAFTNGVREEYVYADGLLTKTLTYEQSAEDSKFYLTKAEELERENGMVKRTNYYVAVDGNLEKTSYKEIDTNEEGSTTAERVYDAAGNLTTTIAYKYIAGELTEITYYTAATETEEARPVKSVEFKTIMNTFTTETQYEYSATKGLDDEYAKYTVSLTKYNTTGTYYSMEKTAGNMTTSGVRMKRTFDEAGNLTSLEYATWDPSAENGQGMGDWSEDNSALITSTSLLPEPEPEPEPTPTAVAEAENMANLSIIGKSIVVNEANGQNVTVTKLNGQVVAQTVANAQKPIELSTSGLYIVTVGNKSVSIVVK